ncbi:hypothetical protein E2542_SST10994 [Spatholobus suberectus]|nr:hypothetical protein E2542_SST10994 [Spatholobus suberectus]
MEDEEWELCNDDFIYKCKRERLNAPLLEANEEAAEKRQIWRKKPNIIEVEGKVRQGDSSVGIIVEHLALIASILCSSTLLTKSHHFLPLLCQSIRPMGPSSTTFYCRKFGLQLTRVHKVNVYLKGLILWSYR